MKISQYLNDFEMLYKHHNGFLLSQRARQHNNALDLTYGEIEFTSLIALLSLVRPNKNTVFYDLGSGIGKAVTACAMVFPVSKAVGIELLKPLHNCAIECATQLSLRPAYEESASKMQFIHGNFLEVNLNEATFIFINSSTIINPTWEQLCNRLDFLPCLETVITTSKPMKTTQFSIVKTTKVQMSWGVVEAYIQARQTNLN